MRFFVTNILPNQETSRNVMADQGKSLSRSYEMRYTNTEVKILYCSRKSHPE